MQNTPIDVSGLRGRKKNRLHVYSMCTYMHTDDYSCGVLTCQAKSLSRELGTELFISRLIMPMHMVMSMVGVSYRGRGGGCRHQHPLSPKACGWISDCFKHCCNIVYKSTQGDHASTLGGVPSNIHPPCFSVLISSCAGVSVADL